MELTVSRRTYTFNSTIGQLLIDGSYFCHTLEDRVRAPGVKIAGATCIPEGRYRVIVDWSPNHLKFLPHVLNVPMFTGIRIHTGNTDVDTSGCLLLGLQEAPDQVSQSLLAFNMFCPKLSDALVSGQEVWITFMHDPSVVIPPELLKEA